MGIMKLYVSNLDFRMFMGIFSTVANLILKHIVNILLKFKKKTFHSKFQLFIKNSQLRH